MFYGFLNYISKSWGRFGGVWKEYFTFFCLTTHSKGWRQKLCLTLRLLWTCSTPATAINMFTTVQPPPLYYNILICSYFFRKLSWWSSKKNYLKKCILVFEQYLREVSSFNFFVSYLIQVTDAMTTIFFRWINNLSNLPWTKRFFNLHGGKCDIWNCSSRSYNLQ